MGRRKIEIQPISHERNRSVTFLKRKNGLFKKAYELGVLCSVDVAVIIFESRPGHEVKLHEYSSSDIRNIVQRQSRHQGDTDLKVPSDFSGPTSKFDDGGDADGDEDIGDEEKDAPVAKPGRRRGQGRLTLPTNANDYSVPLPPPPPPVHHLHPESAGGALLSVANDRVSNMRDLHPTRPNKRSRTARSRSPSDDTMIPALPAINPEWGLSQDNPAMGRYGPRNVRHLHNPPPPGLSQQQQQEHQQYHSMHQQQQHQQHPGHGFQYTPMFPVSNQVSPPPAFIPLHQDFGSSRGLPPFTTTRPGGSSGPEGGAAYADLHQRMRPSDSPTYDPAPYPPNTNSMTRHPEHRHHHHQSLLSHPPPSPPPFPSSTAAGSHRREDRGPDGLFGSLLEADERSSRQQRSGSGSGGSSGTGGAGLDWPMHDGLTTSSGRSAPTSAGPTGPRGSLDGPVNPANGSSDSWFDFLSRSNPINEHSNSGGRRSSSSSSTWPPPPLPLARNGDGSSTTNIEVARHKARDVDDGLFDGRKKESGGGGGEGEGMSMNEENPVLKCEQNVVVVEGDKGGQMVEDNERSEDGDKIKI